MIKSAAFILSEQYKVSLVNIPGYVDEFALLKPIFARHGVDLVAVDWQDEGIDWLRFDLVLPLACWGYVDHAQSFAAFIERTASLNVPMKNSSELILWNMRKTYLRDLKNKGLNVGDLLIIPQGSAVAINEWLKKITPSQWLVAKPSISAGAKRTEKFLVTDMAHHIPLFSDILGDSDLIIQPFFRELTDEGEYSYFFFAGEFSHAILKKPAKGDYRAHRAFNAKIERYTPTVDQIQQAANFIRDLLTPCFYARVDVFNKNGALYLVELELIEPNLYFEEGPEDAPEKFCQAILGAV